MWRYDLFSAGEITPESFCMLEHRLEKTLREIGRRLVQATLAGLETDQADRTPARIHWEGSTWRRNRKTNHLIDTRFGPVTIARWCYQNTIPGEAGMAPLDLRLGLFAGRMSPALTEVVGRLAADLPQQAVLEILHERFLIQPGVATLRKAIADLASKVRVHHDDVAIQRLGELLAAASRSEGQFEPVFQVGRDGVYVPTRPCWEEASCGTLAIYDRSRRRLGTVYLGQMPESEQPTMTARLTRVITETLAKAGEHLPKLRYVTDAGCHPQSYFREVLKKMKHPLTGHRLAWSWGVDFYHACEYVSTLAVALLGNQGNAAEAWAKKQREVLKTQPGGISRLIRSAAQQKRRRGLKGTKTDYDSSINYLKKYRKHMDYAQRRAAGEPIGSGITEAGCKVIFNQRMKQSGMRWHCDTGQLIVDLRTAVRSQLWDKIWRRIIQQNQNKPPITRKSVNENAQITHVSLLLN